MDLIACKVVEEHLEGIFFLGGKAGRKSTNTAGSSSALFEPSSWWMISRNNVPVTLNHIKTWLTFNFSPTWYARISTWFAAEAIGIPLKKRIKISGIICLERDIGSRKVLNPFINEAVRDGIQCSDIMGDWQDTHARARFKACERRFDLWENMFHLY